MYNDTIDVSNKIITSEDLLEIFEKINAEFIRISELSKEEEIKNANIESENQIWAFKRPDMNIKCTFNFYDSTTITVDTYEAFLNLYNTRLTEIKDMWFRCHIYYSKGVGYQTNSISNSIQMYIYENKMNITTNISSSDNTLNDVYELIKSKVLNAPERYDDVIKKKGSITNKIGFSIGIIPAIIVFALLAIVPFIRTLYGSTYILFPILVLISAFLVGTTLFTGKINSLYSAIEPDKKYAGYDNVNNKSIYKDDINSFTAKSEILIGKNVNNLQIRKEILDMNEKYSKLIPTELMILVAVSIVMVVIGKLF
jgi:hypothetical protein